LRRRRKAAIDRQRIGQASGNRCVLAARDRLELGERLVDSGRRQVAVEVPVIDRLRQGELLGKRRDCALICRACLEEEQAASLDDLEDRSQLGWGRDKTRAHQIGQSNIAGRPSKRPFQSIEVLPWR